MPRRPWRASRRRRRFHRCGATARTSAWGAEVAQCAFCRRRFWLLETFCEYHPLSRNLFDAITITAEDQCRPPLCPAISTTSPVPPVSEGQAAALTSNPAPPTKTPTGGKVARHGPRSGSSQTAKLGAQLRGGEQRVRECITCGKAFESDGRTTISMLRMQQGLRDEAASLRCMQHGLLDVQRRHQAHADKYGREAASLRHMRQGLLRVRKPHQAHADAPVKSTAMVSARLHWGRLTVHLHPLAAAARLLTFRSLAMRRAP